MNIGTAAHINLVVVYNTRGGQKPSRIEGAVVWVENGKKKHKCGTINYNAYHFVYYIACDGAKGTVVKIEQPRKDYLHVAEVEVYGGCTSCSSY